MIQVVPPTIISTIFKLKYSLYMLTMNRKFYADGAAEEAGGYGYASDEVKMSPFDFGLNAGNAFLKKFEFTPTGGKDGAEQEALEIVFTINGTDKNYRMFPVTKAFDADNKEVTDPNSTEMKEARTDFNARITHILHCFMNEQELKAGLARPIKSFKEFVELCMKMLPKNFSEKPLDIFMQYQWKPSEGQTKTYLDLPTKMKHGKWVCAAVKPEGAWKQVRMADPDTSERLALKYVDEKGNVHPFTRTGWFVNSPFANQQRPANDNTGSNGGEGASTANHNTGATTGGATSGNKPAAW